MAQESIMDLMQIKRKYTGDRLLKEGDNNSVESSDNYDIVLLTEKRIILKMLQRQV